MTCSLTVRPAGTVAIAKYQVVGFRELAMRRKRLTVALIVIAVASVFIAAELGRDRPIGDEIECSRWGIQYNDSLGGVAWSDHIGFHEYCLFWMRDSIGLQPHDPHYIASNGLREWHRRGTVQYASQILLATYRPRGGQRALWVDPLSAFPFGIRVTALHASNHSTHVVSVFGPVFLLILSVPVVVLLMLQRRMRRD